MPVILKESGESDYIIVSAANYAYFRSLLQLLLSVRRHASAGKPKFIIFDLGLTVGQKQYFLRRFQEVELRTVDFSVYPPFVGVRNREINTNAWKPQVIMEVFKAAKVPVLWLDSATVITRSLTPILDFVLEFGVYAPFGGAATIGELTHHRMLEYMQAEDYLMNLRQRASGVVGLLPGNTLAHDLLSEWARFCLVEECSIPHGASHSNHRFDQSIFNVLFYRMVQTRELHFTNDELDISSYRPVKILRSRNKVSNRIPLAFDAVVRVYFFLRRLIDVTIINLQRNRDLLARMFVLPVKGVHRLFREYFKVQILQETLQTRLATGPLEYAADPFIISSGEQIYVFFERFNALRCRGEIAVATLNRRLEFTRPVVTLIRENWHLSFPYVFLFRGRYFMIPESSAHRTIDLYESSEFPYRWKFSRTLVSGVDAADTVLIESQGGYYLLTALREAGPGNHRFLAVYSAKSPRAISWAPHPVNQEKRNSDLSFSSGRNAGTPFLKDGTWVRPVQKNNKYYGEGLEFRRILRLNEKEFIEEDVTGSSDTDFLECHHLSRDGSFFACDYRSRVAFLKNIAAPNHVNRPR